MPDASEPPMWKSHGSLAFCRTRMTSIGRPRAAHTLLKLTPAAITATSTWSGARAGTSTSSTWNAVRGSPKRSWRMTWASIRLGTSPTGGSSPIDGDSDPGISCPPCGDRGGGDGQAGNPGARQPRSLRVQVAGGPAAGHRERLGVDLPADLHRVRAAAVEAASARGVGRAGDVAVQDDALAGPLHPGVGDRHRRQQRLAVRV